MGLFTSADRADGGVGVGHDNGWLNTGHPVLGVEIEDRTGPVLSVQLGRLELGVRVDVDGGNVRTRPVDLIEVVVGCFVDAAERQGLIVVGRGASEDKATVFVSLVMLHFRHR